MAKTPAGDERGLSGRGRRWRSTALIGLAAVLVAGGTWVRLRVMERRSLAGVAEVETPASVMDTARVLGSVRQLKLVTVEIATHVNAESIDESWRGDVRARVDAPVKLHFGTDLSRLRADSVRANALGNSWIVTVPPPERVATEVFGEREETDVRVGWLRSRGMAGEKQLGLARRDLYDSARRLRLTPDDAQRVRAGTREQVAALVRTIVGPWASVTVRFEDEVEGLAAARGAEPAAAQGERQ